MSNHNHTIHRDVSSLAPVIREVKAKTATASAKRSCVCGFSSIADTTTSYYLDNFALTPAGNPRESGMKP